MQSRDALRCASVLLATFVFVSCSATPSQGGLTECKASLSLCMAREVAANEFPNPDLLIEAFVIDGAISDIARWASDTGRKHRGFRFEMRGDFSKLSEEAALASVALAAAAFNSADPYADTEWLAIGSKFLNDHEVSLRAALLIRDIGYEPWERIFRNPSGLEAIWRRTLATSPDDFDMLMELSNELSFYGPQSLKPLAREILSRAIALPNLSPEQLAEAAGKLAQRFNDPEAAQALMDAGGYRAQDREISGKDDLLAAAAKLHAEEQGAVDFSVTVFEMADITGKDADIAESRLRRGVYNVEGAKRVADRLLGDSVFGHQYSLESLRRGGATKELQEIGNVWLERARATHGDAFEAVTLYAAASDAFRLAGDKEAAVMAARTGMPLIPMALDDRADIPSIAERKRLAGEDNGMRVAPALALFQAGKEQEALTSGYVSGLDLLQYWERPLADFDPHWITDGSPKWFDVVLSEVLDRDDPAFAARLYDAIAEASFDIEPVQFAVLAAAAGKADRIEAHINGILAQAADRSRHPTDRPYYLLQAARARKAAETLLAHHPH